MSDFAPRIRALDWLRGIAVVVMIQTHALALLRPDLRSGTLFYRLNWVDGLVAPSFILAAGFSLALVQVRGASSGSRGRRAFKSLRRIGEVLLVASFMVTLWFPIIREPFWLLRVDILQCIGLSLLAALPVFAGLSDRPRLLAAVSSIIGLVLLVATAYMRNNFTGVGRFFFGGTLSGATFSLLPWSSYIFLGGALGALAAKIRVSRLALSVVGLAGAGLALWFLANFMVIRMPNSHWGITGNHAERIMVVSGIILVLLAAEQWIPNAWRQGKIVRFVEIFGASSLSAYFGHEVFLYKNIFGFCFNTVWGKSASWPKYWLLTGALVMCTLVFTWCVAWLYDHAGAWRKALFAKNKECKALAPR